MHDAASRDGTVAEAVELDWRTTVGRVLPDDDVLATAVAEELDEPLEDVRPSVMTATLVRRVDASLDDLKAVVDGERARARVRAVATTPAWRRAPGPRGDPRGPPGRDAPARGRRHARPARGRGGPARGRRDRGALGDAPGAVPRPARGHPPPRLGPLRRRAAGRPARCRRPRRDGPLDLPVDRDHLAGGHRRLPGRRARDPRPRRAGPPQRPRGAPGRRRLGRAHRRAAAPGRHPVRAGPGRELPARRVAPRQEADPTPDRAGIDEGDLEVLAGRIGHLLGSAAAGTEGAGAGIRLPVGAADAGPDRAPRARRLGGLRPDHRGAGRTLGGPARSGAGAAGAGAGDRRSGPRSRRRGSPSARRWSRAWSRSPAVLADVVDAVRTAEDVGLRGWIPDPGHLAVERLLLAQRELGEAAVAHELGPLLADDRLGRS